MIPDRWCCRRPNGAENLLHRFGLLLWIDIIVVVGGSQSFVDEPADHNTTDVLDRPGIKWQSVAADKGYVRYGTGSGWIPAEFIQQAVGRQHDLIARSQVCA